MTGRVVAESANRGGDELRRAAKALALGVVLGALLAAASGRSPAAR